MSKNPLVLNGVRIALLLCTPLLLLLSNLYLLATPALVGYEYSKPQFPPADLYNAAERVSLAQATVHYLRSNEGPDYLANLQAHGRGVYNAREIKHLVDVKAVMRGAFWVHGVCALLLALAIVLSWQRGLWPQALQAVYQGCAALLGWWVTIGLLAYTNFDLFFTAFHRVFFAGDSWLFAFSDTLIQLFPVQFWIDVTWMLAVVTVGECVLVGAAAYALSRRLRAYPLTA